MRAVAASLAGLILAGNAAGEAIAGTTLKVPGSAAGQLPTISGNGRYVGFTVVTCNGFVGCFSDGRVADLQTRKVVALCEAGVEAETIGFSFGGRFVLCDSDAASQGFDPLDDVFVVDRRTGQRTSAVTARDGGEPDGFSFARAISTSGRFVLFDSSSTNLVARDMNGKTDVFVRDMQAGTTALVSVDSRGRPANRDSSGAGISADGRYVTFVSRATNLVAGDTNGEQDVFLRDRTAGTTERVNVGAGGEQANGTSLGGLLSADGSVVAFASAATNLTAGAADGRRHVFVRDRRAGTTTLVSVGLGGAPANASSDVTALSPDGGFVAFQSAATDLVPGDTNRKLDVFVRDLRAGTTARASVARDGGQAYGRSGNGVISGGGREIAFTSDAGNLVPGGTDRFGDVFVRRR